MNGYFTNVQKCNNSGRYYCITYKVGTWGEHDRRDWLAFNIIKLKYATQLCSSEFYTAVRKMYDVFGLNEIKANDAQ